mgnify:CR=1 FL=1
MEFPPKDEPVEYEEPGTSSEATSPISAEPYTITALPVSSLSSDEFMDRKNATELKNRITKVITTTTRKPRKGEVDGKDYFFVTKSQLKVLASKVPFGKEKALIPQSKRIPEGPSSQQQQGIPKY